MTGKRLDHLAEVGTSNHAVEKLRERLPLGCSLNSLGDKDLRALLQKAWTYAKDTGAIGLWWERVNGTLELNHVVDLSEVMEGGLVGIAREDARVPNRPCYVTVITADMAERSKNSGKWVQLGEPVPADSPPSEEYVLSWDEDGKPQVIIVTKAKIQDIVSTLAGKGDTVLNSLRIWAPVSFSVERVVRVLL